MPRTCKETIKILRTALGVLCLAAPAIGAAQDTFRCPATSSWPMVLGDAVVEAHDVRLESCPEDPGSVRLEFGAGTPWPNVFLRSRGVAYAIKPGQSLVLHVENAENRPVELSIRAGNDDEASWPEHAVAGRVMLSAHEHADLLMPLWPSQSPDMGMQGVGPPPDAAVEEPLPIWQVTGTAPGEAIRTIVFVVDGSHGSVHLAISRVRAASMTWNAARWSGLFDRYGQSRIGNWPGKVRTDADLQFRSAFRAGPDLPRLPPLDAFGGLTERPLARPTGYFQIVRDASHRYRLASPAGNAFFSLGVNTLSIDPQATFVTGRERLFTDLPQDGPLAAFYTHGQGAAMGASFHGPTPMAGLAYNFYAANLFRSLGPDFRKAWIERTTQRLKEWNFNTVGQWSDAAFQSNARMPYTQAIVVTGDYDRLVGLGDYWGAMPDPFDPRYQAALHAAVIEASRGRTDDPWLIGYFLENELPWGDATSTDPRQHDAAVLAALGSWPKTAASRALIGWLVSRHGSSLAWQRAWSASDDEMTHPDRLARRDPKDWTAAMRDDIAAFDDVLADQYFRTAASAIRESDTHHLFLGGRFAQWSNAALQACSRWCDVVSVNLYTDALPEALAARLAHLDHAILISEFSFVSTDRGPFGRPLGVVADEAERGRSYARFLADAQKDPRIVGLHWFEYVDEPASGRMLDGENAHFGLVAITDVPSVGFIDVVMRANRLALAAIRSD